MMVVMTMIVCGDGCMADGCMADDCDTSSGRERMWVLEIEANEANDSRVSSTLDLLIEECDCCLDSLDSDLVDSFSKSICLCSRSHFCGGVCCTGSW